MDWLDRKVTSILFILTVLDKPAFPQRSKMICQKKKLCVPLRNGRTVEAHCCFALGALFWESKQAQQPQ